MKLLRSCTYYTNEQPITLSLSGLIEAVQKHALFQPCNGADERKEGFDLLSEDEGGSFAYETEGLYVLRYRVQTKLLPGSVVNDELRKRIQAIQTAESRKVAGKEKKELKEQIKIELLSKAFTKDGFTYVYIDTVHQNVVIESASQKQCDNVIGALVRIAPDLTLKPWNVDESAANTLKNLFLAEHEAQPEHSLFGDEIRLQGGVDGSIHYKKVNLWHPSIFTTIEEHPLTEISMVMEDVTFTFIPQTCQWKGINTSAIMDEHKESFKEMEHAILRTEATMLLQRDLTQRLFQHMHDLLVTS